MRFIVRLTAWLSLVFFTWLITRNSLLYFTEPRAHGFVWEKRALADKPLWLGALVLHVAAGIVCLAASFLQFFRPVFRRLPALHRHLGRIYVASVLLVLAPTGFYLAFFAHGGVPGTIGFLVLGVLTTWTTWRGWREMRAGRMRQHVVWMIRSMAMVTTAITFRLEHIAFQLLGIAPELGFLLALYLSIAGNALVAEFLLHRFHLLPKRQNITNRGAIRPDHEKDQNVPVGARLG